MTSTYLLDANALIALVIADHEHHGRAARWVARVGAIAVCPIVQGALIRYLLRVGESRSTAVAILSGLQSSPQCEFWPDEISYSVATLDHVVGHRQVTDAYLASLAASRGSRLATFDHALVEALPGCTELIRWARGGIVARAYAKALDDAGVLAGAEIRPTAARYVNGAWQGTQPVKWAMPRARLDAFQSGIAARELSRADLLDWAADARSVSEPQVGGQERGGQRRGEKAALVTTAVHDHAATEVHVMGISP